jgi:hypothetical protein
MQAAISYEKPKSKLTRQVVLRLTLLGVILLAGIVTFNYVSTPSILQITRTQDGNSSQTIQQRTLLFSPYVATLFAQLSGKFRETPVDNYLGILCAKDGCYPGITYDLLFSIPGQNPQHRFVLNYWPPDNYRRLAGISSAQVKALDRAFAVWDVPFISV